MIEHPGILLAVLGALNLVLLLAVLIGRARTARKEQRREWVRNFIQVAFRQAPIDEIVRVVQRDLDAFLDAYVLYADSVQLPESQQKKLKEALVLSHEFPRLLRRLRRGGKLKRMESAIRLSYALANEAAPPLIDALQREKSRSVRLHIIQALVQLQNPAVVSAIIDSLQGNDAEYQEKVFGILSRLGSELFPFVEALHDHQEPEIQFLLLRISALRRDQPGYTYIVEHLTSTDAAIRQSAARLVLDNYLEVLDIKLLLKNDDRMVRNLAVEALGRLTPERALPWLLEASGSAELQKSAVVGMSSLVRNRPETYSGIVEALLESTDESRRSALLQVLSNRVEYLIERVLREPETSWTAALTSLIESGRTSGIIAFLNRNSDEGVEQRISAAVADSVRSNELAKKQFSMHARESVVKRLGLEQVTQQTTRGTRIGEAVRPIFVIGILAATILLPAGVFVLIRILNDGPPLSMTSITDYARWFTIGFGYYAFTLNLIYLILISAAAVAVRSQQRSLEIKPLSMLFSPGVLPAISIIAPAYNEEATIAQSIRSLLNLRYPSLEIVVVNDGSADATLEVLIREFELERADIFVHSYLDTQPVRGVYSSAQIPELVVIDKQNGGKADSLNAGINASRNAYFAAIDSDSLLERDSLLRLASRFLDAEKPVVATGGNIFPINGCRVSSGSIDEIRLPKSTLGKLQTLEYLRSFMSGRTGWAALNSLMIISGAFGLFNRKVVVDAHGYLTGTGYYGKDTVAEDMELVVRVARLLRERGEPFSIQYGYNANCWTEVPTTFRILRNQRDRWQRGLIDTMVYHLRLLGNPRHGTVGLVGFPYFFLFELLGPWIEVQGLLFLVGGLIAGTVPSAVLLFILATTVPMGIVVSLAALLLAERHERYFSGRDRALLIVFAFLENFGYRQYASLIRLRGYVSALFKRTGWGAMVRTGFSGGNKSGET